MLRIFNLCDSLSLKVLQVVRPVQQVKCLTDLRRNMRHGLLLKS